MLHVQGEPATTATALELNAPTHQLVLRSSYDLDRRVSLDAQLRYVDNVQSVKAYATADVRLSFRPRPNLELSIIGQNLFQDHHAEQASPIGRPLEDVPRGVYGKITWHF